VSLISLPGLKVIAGCEQIETGLFGARSELNQLRAGELFVREHEPSHSLA
jgi:hypothetical protein